MRGLNFEDERYVRLYTRDSVAWLRLGWEAQAVYMGLKRKFDRVGLLRCDGESSVDAASAVLVGWDFDVIERGIETMLERGWLEYLNDADALFDPQHMEAEETSKSNALRCKESRERRRQKAAAEALGVELDATQDASETTQNMSGSTQNASGEPATLNASEPTQNASEVKRNVSPPTRNMPGSTQNASEGPATQNVLHTTQNESEVTRNASGDLATQNASHVTQNGHEESVVTQNASGATQKCRNRRSVTQRDAPTHSHTHSHTQEEGPPPRAQAPTRVREGPPDFPEYSEEELFDLAEALWKSDYPLKGSRAQLDRAIFAVRRLPPKEQILASLEVWIAFYQAEEEQFVKELHNWVKDERWEARPRKRSTKRQTKKAPLGRIEVDDGEKFDF